MDQLTAMLIEKHYPMWTNKQIWEYEQIHENVKFDAVYVEPGQELKWNSKLSHPSCNIRDTIIQTFGYLSDGLNLCISNPTNSNPRKLDSKYFPYLMALIVDVMIDDEICLNFREENNCLVISIDTQTDVIDCKEFFEEFYHLATGFNYETNTGIPKDETESEIYLTRLQEEFDEKMKQKLGDKYLPGNNDPDSINEL